MNIKKFLDKNCIDLKDKVIVLNGSTGGLGQYIAKMLVMKNANLILLDRDLVKGEILKKQLKEINGNVFIKQIPVDLSNFNSLIDGIKQLNEFEKIDALILNAGAYHLPRVQSDEYNQVFKINFISPYFLAKKLLPKLRKSSLAKVVVMSSLAYKFTTFNSNDIDYTSSNNANKIYGNSKKFLMTSLFELFKNEKKVTLSIVHPGITYTNITRHFNKFLKFIIKVPMKIVFNSPKKASICAILGLNTTLNSYEWLGPKYFDIWGKPIPKNIKNISENEKLDIYNLANEIYNQIESQLN